VIDLGDITTARGTEMYLPLWTRIWAATQNPMFNVKVVRYQARDIRRPCGASGWTERKHSSDARSTMTSVPATSPGRR
jgi:hypothetical protein